MRRLIILIVLVCGLVIVPNSGFTQDIQRADAYIFPDTGNLLNGFGGFVGGDVPGSYDWAIGNRSPYPDTNPTTDAMVFSTYDGVAWSERMRITKEGVVIGPTNPGSPLSIRSTDRQIDLLDSDYADYSWSIRNNDGAFIITESGPIDRLYIQSGGNVGIGIASPEEQLHIAGYSANDYIIRPRINIENLNDSNDNGTAITFKGRNTYWAVGTDYGWTGENNFYIADLNLNEKRILIDSSGNVGIGTTSPQRHLHIDGGQASYIRVDDDDGDDWTIGAEGTGFVFYSVTDNAYRMVVDNNGNVGIGTTSPQGTLDVNGSIYQRGSLLHADYVFEPDYKLESIEEHAEHMWNNKHLKAIPKAMVDENGQEIVEVGSHRKGMVEELEKAHIYIEQLYKQIKEQSNQIKKLKERLAKLETKDNVVK